MDTEECQIPGHTLILPNTMNSMGHGRIALLVRNDIKVHKLNKHMSTEIATIWVQVGKSQKSGLVVGGIYREHQQLGRINRDSTWMEKKLEQEGRWNTTIEQWLKAGKDRNTVVIGDINLDFLKWTQPDQFHEEMVEMTQNRIETAGYVQIIKEKTRTWRGQADSCLDHVWTNCHNKTLSHFNKTRGQSDHNVVGITVSTKNIKIGTNNMLKRTWKNFNKNRCLEKFKNGDWDRILNELNVDVANTMLEEEILKIMEDEAPLKTVQMRAHYNNWITCETKVEMSRRDKLREVAKLTDLEIDWKKFRESRNLCTSLQRKDKSKFHKKMFEKIEEEKDAKKLFGNAKNLLGWTSPGPPSCFQVEGRTIRSQKELANEQIKFYENKVKDIKNSLPGVGQDPLRYLRLAFERWDPAGGKPKFSLKSTTTKEVVENIKALKNSKAFGRDKIDAITIKLGAPYIAPAIAHVINLSLGEGKFPQKWKLARIIPLQKSKTVDRQKPGSFRPVSLLPLISKLAERVVQKQILNYLEVSGLLSARQHAYRHKCSTTTALIELMDTVATAADENTIAATMGLDQSSAFDAVDHKI